MLPDGITVRDACAADALCVRALGVQVFLETYAPGGIDAAMAREVHAEFEPETVHKLFEATQVRLFLAERDGRAVGFAQLHAGSACPVPDVPGQMEMQRLYVQAASKGTGAGKALLRRCEALALELGAPALWLRAWAGNHRAREFYARQGYRDVGRADYVFEGRAFENRVFARMLPS